ncbi:9601_t:CDS:2, partial [Funneliformis mosseae]
TKEANGWPNNRRVAIAAGMLREEAADWYNLDETYASRFKKLANRINAGGIPEAFKVRMFLSGLNKELATLVAIQNPANLDAAIIQAKT